MTPENRIRDAICKWLNLHYHAIVFIHDSVGIYDPKIKRFRRNMNRFRVKGVSDLIGIWNGKPLAIEVKAGRNKATPEQLSFLELWRAKGGIGILAYSLEDVMKALKGSDVKQGSAQANGETRSTN